MFSTIKFSFKQANFSNFLTQNKTYYIVNGQFWKNWLGLIESETPNEITIDTREITEFRNKLKPDLKYGEDYIVLIPKVYQLFSNWHGRVGEEFSFVCEELSVIEANILKFSSNQSKPSQGG